MADKDAPGDVEDVTSYEAPDLSRLTGEQRKLFEKLTAPFRPEEIEILPKPYKGANNGDCRVCGGFHGLPAAHLSYVGHAGITMRLIEVDPTWSWEPLHPDIDERALAAAVQSGNVEALEWLGRHSPPRIENGGIWIRLRVAGVTAVGFGDADGRTSAPGDVKVMIGDAIRNAAMRMGVGTYLWSKSDKAKAMLAQHGSDDDERQALPASKPAKRARGDQAKPQQGEDPRTAHPLTDEGKDALSDLLATDDPDQVRTLWREIRAAGKPQTVTLDILGDAEAAALGIAGPLDLFEVATKVGEHLKENGISVAEHVAALEVPGPMGSGDAEAVRDAADLVRRPDDSKVRELRKAARGQNGGQQG